MNDRMKAALIGGVTAGVLSALPLVSSCCCLWAIGGGLLAVYLYYKDSPTPMQPADGATIGGIAGGIAAVVSLVLGLPIALAFGAAAFEQAMRQANVTVPFTGFALIVISTIVRAVFVAGLSVLGGVIGVAIFNKNRPGGSNMPPPPPPSFSAGAPPPPPAGGGYNSTFGTGS